MTTTDAATATSSAAGRDPAALLEAVKLDAAGLVPVIAQDARTGGVRMFAWANREALELTARTGQGHFYSRSRQALWRKGETSGHVQRVREVRLDCDADTIVLSVESAGGIACHTGRRRCFFRRLEGDGASRRWVETEAAIAGAESPDA